MFGPTSQNLAYIVLLALIVTIGFGAWFGGWPVDPSALEAI